MKSFPAASKFLAGKPFHQANTPWVAPACADCPGFLVLGSAPPWLPPWSRSLRLFPWASIFPLQALGHCLDLLPAAPPPSVPKRVGNQPAPYRGLSGSPGPKCRESLENVSRGLRPGDPKKSPKSPGTLQKHSRHTFRGAGGAEETFSRLFRRFGPAGPERPL